MRTALALALMGAVGMATASPTAGTVLERCTLEPTSPYEAKLKAGCAGYMKGLYDGHRFLEAYTGGPLFCIGKPDAPAVLFTEALIWHLAASPEQAELPARGVIYLALSELYPC